MLGKEITQNELLPLVKKFLNDQIPDVKQGILSNLPTILMQISEEK